MKSVFSSNSPSRSSPLALSAIVAVLLVAASSCSAAEPNCTDRPECWPEGSAMHTGLILVQKRQSADSELESKHAGLLSIVASSRTGGAPVDSRLLEALRRQQAAWLSYRSQECELVGALTGAGGSWPSTYAVQCETNQAELRLRQVSAATLCVQEIPPSTRVAEQGRCLQKLAPLTNGP